MRSRGLSPKTLIANAVTGTPSRPLLIECGLRSEPSLFILWLTGTGANRDPTENPVARSRSQRQDKRKSDVRSRPAVRRNLELLRLPRSPRSE